MTGNVTLRFFKGCQPDSAANSTVTCRETSQIRWIIAKIAVEEAGYRLMEVARYLSRDAGVMSRGLRWLEYRVQNAQDIPQENWYNTTWNPKGDETPNSKKSSLTPVTFVPQ